MAFPRSDSSSSVGGDHFEGHDTNLMGQELHSKVRMGGEKRMEKKGRDKGRKRVRKKEKNTLFCTICS